jgi:hypothetical protein
LVPQAPLEFLALTVLLERQELVLLESQVLLEQQVLVLREPPEQQVLQEYLAQPEPQVLQAQTAQPEPQELAQPEPLALEPLSPSGPMLRMYYLLM